ncbi:MAG: acryloyl-coenzyme A reductase [Sulfolobaceae archaeon]
MKAIVLPAYKQGFKVQEVQKPKPSKDEVLVKVRYGGLCYRDLLQIEGFYPRSKYPLILGHEMVGEIEEIGDSVEGFRVGERVTSLLYVPDYSCRFCKMGEEVYCNSRILYAQDLDGFFAEYAIVKANSIIRIPDGVSYEGSIIVPCVVGMIYRGLRRARIEKDFIVLVTGSGGGVGIHSVQVAKALGAKVIGVTSSPDKAEVIKKYADHVIIGSKFSDEVRKLVGEVDVVLDNVGPFTIEESLKVLRVGGKLVQIGNLDPSQSISLRLGYIILKNIEIIGHAGATRRDIEEGFRLVKEGKVIPIISHRIPINEFNKALSILKSKSNLGKVVITTGE